MKMMRMIRMMLRKRSAEDEDVDHVGSDDGDCDCDNDFLRSAESFIVRCIGGLSCAENDVSDDDEDA